MLIQLIKKYFTLIIVFCIPTVLIGQMNVIRGDEAPNTPENIIENVFLGGGVEILNITYNGSSQAVGIFDNGASVIGIDEGLVLSTGRVDSIPLENVLNNPQGVTTNGLEEDIDLQNAANINQIKDVASYEITFRPVSDSIQFKYVFASEEYPNFVCTSKNDVFGFFISGPNPNGGMYNAKNIALIPDPADPSGLTFLDFPVSINFVNGGEVGVAGGSLDLCTEPLGSLNYSNYYNAVPEGASPVFNAYLDVFIAAAAVTACEEYTIKLAIGDAIIPDNDSAVFLEAKSFTSESLDVSLNTTSADGAIVEGCDSAEFEIFLSSPAESDKVLDIRLLPSGTFADQASSVSDFSGFPNEVIVPQGESSAKISIQAIEDNIPDDNEFVYIEVIRNRCFTDTLKVRIRDRVMPPLALVDNVIVCEGIPMKISADFAFEPPLESNSQTFSSFEKIDIIEEGFSYFSSIFVEGVSGELSDGMLTSVCIDNLVGRDLHNYDIFLIGPEDQVLELSSDNGSRVKNPICDELDPFNVVCIDTFKQTCFTPIATESIENGNPTLGPSYPNNLTYTGDFQPEGSFNSFINNSTINGEWKLLVRLDEQPSQEDLDAGINFLSGWNISFNASYAISYLWSPDGPLDNSCPTCPETNVFPLEETTYTIQVTDTYGCQDSGEINVTVEPTPQFSNILRCDVLTPASIELEWEDVATDEDIFYNIRINGSGPWYTSISNIYQVNGLANDAQYMFELRVNNGTCVSEKDTIFCMTPPCIGEPPVIDSISVVDETCFGYNNGLVRAFAYDPEGTDLTYYILARTSTDGQIFGLPPNDYELRITDEAGCTTLDSIFIERGVELMYDVQVQDISCSGLEDASILVDTLLDEGPFYIQWLNEIDGFYNENLGEEDYIFTLTNGIGCFALDTISITDPEELIFENISVGEATCGLPNGIIDVKIKGGSGPYNYNWVELQENNNIIGAYPGSYNLIVTDARNCEISTNISVTGDPPIELAQDSFMILCPLDSLGSITLSPSGGTGPYDLLWSTGDTGLTISNLTSGTHEVSVTDARNCTSVFDIVLGYVPDLSYEFEIESPTCFDSTNGNISITAINDSQENPISNLTVTWEDGTVGNNIQNLIGDSLYAFQVDVVGDCIYPAEVFLDSPMEIDPNFIIVTPLSCFGDSIGIISVSPTGGTGPINVTWDSEVETLNDVAINLSSGMYHVTLTDSLSCVKVDSIFLSEAQAININASVNNVTCFGDSNGSISIDPIGGSNNLTWEWSTTEVDSTITGLEGGVYYITLNDNGCLSTDTVTVIEATGPFSIDVETIDLKCAGLPTGEIIIDAFGGIGPYTYQLDTFPFISTSSFVNIDTGFYKITAMDSLGCTIIVNDVLIGEAPFKEINLGGDRAVNIGQDLIIEYTSNTEIVSIQWEITNETQLSCTDCLELTVNDIQSTSLLSVTATDIDGCVLTDSQLIVVQDDSFIAVPTGFSPNGDSVNDRLIVYGIPGVKLIEFNVYDRLGGLVYSNENYEVNDLSQGWDGTLNGKALNGGVYVWTCRIEQLNGVILDLKGDVTLIR